jgi:putative ABC transport system permease protein
VAVTGFDDRLLAYGGPQLESRQPVYGSDADAYRAVLGDPRLIIVNRNFGRRGGVGGPPQTEVGVGDVVAVKNPAGGATREATVVGLLSVDFVGNGAFVSNQFMTELLAPRVVQNRHYVKAEPGSDIEAVSTRINGALIRNGASANSFRSLVDLNTSQNLAVFSLLRGYLALGLLIGIAGLGVVMVRAVRERRRQIGMLRAMGFSSAIVRRAFLLEAGFIALQGILLGVVLGVITAYQLLVNSDAFGGQRLTFSWPWLALALISVIPLVASLLATAAPAGQASRVRPAIALRMAD